MKHVLSVILVGTLCSLYLFPLTFTFLPVGNTKIYMAVLGLLLFMLNRITSRAPQTARSMVYVSLAALAVSLAGVFSVFLNGTYDYTYAQYLILMWVWAGAAYFVMQCMKKVHGRITAGLVCLYVIGVCVAQCGFALLNEFVPAFKSVVDACVDQQTEVLNEVDRMYGIGASLDTGGSRFACALIMLAYVMVRYAKRGGHVAVTLFHVLLFVFLMVVGSMVARTTLAGAVIALAYLLFTLKDGFQSYHGRIFLSFAGIVLVAAPFGIYLYATSPEMSELFMFAFEAFFNLAGGGEFETHSTTELMDMWTHIPEHLKTWIIGDGYFLNPYAYDPYYIGVHKWAYYMGTDVGYLRFIFYFGLVGLLAFIYFIVCCTRECCRKYGSDKVLFVLLMIMNMVLWAKVATDLFVIFALFLLADTAKPDDAGTDSRQTALNR